MSAISEEWLLLNREKGCSASLALALPLTDHTAAAAAAVHWCMHYWRLIFSLALSSSFSLSTHSSLLGHCSRWSMIHSVSLSLSLSIFLFFLLFPSFFLFSFLLFSQCGQLRINQCVSVCLWRAAVASSYSPLPSSLLPLIPVDIFTSHTRQSGKNTDRHRHRERAAVY